MKTQYQVKGQPIIKETRKRVVSKVSVKKGYQQTETVITKAKMVMVV